VEFRFLPRSFVVGAVGSCAGVMLLAGALFFLQRGWSGRGRIRPEGPSSTVII